LNYNGVVPIGGAVEKLSHQYKEKQQTSQQDIIWTLLFHLSQADAPSFHVLHVEGTPNKK
jgi:hypothetical protein